ncbi:MAG: hypothetical protein KAT35_02060, partial [Candidatus Aenigmarchaeota archaeon]|nr:hypothetical protein [Candidatus Aenigmarchaeota archaeon]
ADQDNEDTVLNIIIWHRNNTKQDSLENISTIGWGNTSLDDEWICEVIPFDGYENGTYENSTTLTILNIPSNITWLSASPTIIEGNGPNTTTLWLNFSDYDNIPVGKPVEFWVRASNGSVYGPYTNSTPTRFAYYNYTATYTLNPSSYWLPGLYDVNATVTDRGIINSTNFSANPDMFTILGYLKLYFVSPTLNETHDMDINMTINLTLWNWNNQSIMALNASFWANTTWAYGFTNPPYNYTSALTNTSPNEYTHVWNLSDYHAGNWSIYAEANLSYYYNITNTTWFWLNHTVLANITDFMTDKTYYDMNENVSMTGNITRKGNVEVNGSFGLYVRKISENESVCMIVSDSSSLNYYEAEYNKTLEDEGFNVTIVDDQEVNAGTWTPSICDMIFWGQADYDNTFLKYIDDRVLAEVQGGKSVVATYYGLMKGLPDMNISLASDWGAGFTNDLNVAQRNHALTGNY